MSSSAASRCWRPGSRLSRSTCTGCGVPRSASARSRRIRSEAPAAVDFRSPQFVTVDGRRLAYEELSPSDPSGTVLLLCGIGAKRRGWYKQLPVLGARFRTLALDYRDVGDSDEVTEPYTIGDVAEDVHELTRTLGIERAR